MNSYEKRIDLVRDYLNRMALDKSTLDYYHGRSILVTGGAGAIGSNLIVALSILVGKSGRVIVLDNLSALKTRNPWNVTPLSNIMFVLGDVRSDIDLKRVFRENPGMVFHLAAFFANQNSIDYPETSAEVDVLGQIRLLEYSRIAGVDKFVYASSGCAIYGSYPELPLREEFISMHLTTPYQINKMTGEMVLQLLSSSLRTANNKLQIFQFLRPWRSPRSVQECNPKLHLLGDAGTIAPNNRDR